MKEWNKISTISKTITPWVNFFCERWKDNTGAIIDYWRVEKENSLIIISEDGENFILPPTQFRPGISLSTLDFPGGRVAIDDDLIVKSRNILKKELAISDKQIIDIKRVSKEPAIINSSFSNQELIIYSATVAPPFRDINIKYTKEKYPDLLKKLYCLQCNYALRLWVEKNFHKTKD